MNTTLDSGDIVEQTRQSDMLHKIETLYLQTVHIFTDFIYISVLYCDMGNPMVLPPQPILL